MKSYKEKLKQFSSKENNLLKITEISDRKINEWSDCHEMETWRKGKEFTVSERRKQEIVWIDERIDEEAGLECRDWRVHKAG